MALSCGIAFAAGDDGVDAESSGGPAAPGGPELVGKRTATSETFRLPDGQLETRIYQTPIHYRDGEGDWTPIEESLQPGAGAAVTNGDNRFDLQLPSRLDEGAVRLTRGEDWISYRLVGPTTNGVDVEENTASYEAPQAETTFEFTSLANGLKEEIVLEDPSAPNSFDYVLEVSDGIVPVLEADGSIKFRDATEKVVAVLPAPVMQDSAPILPAFSDAVNYELSSRQDGSWDLKVEADPDWLEQPERIWPAVIDPSLKLAEAFNSCNLYNGASETYSLCAATGTTAMPAFALYDYPGGPGGSIIDQYGRSALVFNLSAIPTNAYVTGATVGLHAPESAQSTSGVELRKLNETWGGYGASWKNAWCTSYPSNCTKWSVGGGGDFSAPLSEVLTSHRGSQAGWWEFSDGLTATVQDWVANPNTNYGLLVKLRDEQQHECPGGTCLQRMLAFDTGAVADTSKRPYIKVTYYPAAPATQKLVSPTDGTRTPRRLKLKSAWASGSGVTGVTYQWKGEGAWATIPHSLVEDAKGQSVNWPIAVSGGKESEAVYFDARSVGEHQELWGGKIYVRALFDGPIGAEGFSAPVSAEINFADGNVRDASTQVGPGTLDLATGAFTVSAADVSIPALGSSLEFARTNNSRETPKTTGPGSNQGVLGLGWEPSIPVEGSGGSVWRSIREVSEPEEGSYMLLTDIEGGELPFEITPEGFRIPVEAPGWALSSISASLLALDDPSGTRTLFEKNSYNQEYLPVSVSFPGGENNKTTMVYQLVNGERRLKMLIGPAPAGVTCNESNATSPLVKGCRSLVFSYLPATTWGAPASYKDRLAKITYYGPDGGSAGDVAQYSYDTDGRLIEEWDPRGYPSLENDLQIPWRPGSGYVNNSSRPETVADGVLAHSRIQKRRRPRCDPRRAAAQRQPRKPAQQSVDRDDDDRLRGAGEWQQCAL